MEELNIVELIENNPITKLSQNYNGKLLTKIKNNFTESQQQLFVASFYCYLNYNSKTDFVIDLDDIWKWLGFTNKANAKKLLEKYFILDVDYKNLLDASIKQDAEEKKHGGNNKETFMLNVKTFKLFCIKAGTTKSSEIHAYFIQLEEILQEVIQEEGDELKLQLLKKDEQLMKKDEQLEETHKLLKETEQLKGCENIPTIYIYNTDTTKEKCELKIGITNNVLARVKPYKQVCKHGKIEFTISVSNTNIKILETYIHSLLSFSRVRDEVFRIDVDEAKTVILNIINMVTTMQITNDSERQLKLKQLLENENKKIKVSTCEIACQTDFDENIPESTPLLFYDKEVKYNFNEFIETECIVHSDAEISFKDIEGYYRLWNKEKPKKEIFHAFKHYLDTRFKYCRLQKQDKNQMVNGYKGVSCKPIEYKKNIVQSDVQNFIFQVCRFSPGGTILNTSLTDEYKKWKKSVHLEWNEEKDETDIKKYLKSSDYVIYTTVWTHHGNGQGYYGLSLKSDEQQYKKTSTTGKTVEKRDLETNHVLGTWETIAKAAQYENISAPKMSISIKNKVAFNDCYYCISTA